MNNGKESERESIWSVARRLRPLFSVILIIQFLAFLGINAYKVITVDNPGDLFDIITGAYERTSSQSFSILLATYTLTEAIMLASWLKERDQKRELAAEERGMEKGLEEGLERGREEERRAWQAWYNRRRAAEEAGRLFDEPPPGEAPGNRPNDRN